MLIHTIGTIGLFLNLVGIIILFIFGFPQPDFRESVGLAISDGTRLTTGITAKEHKELQIKKKQAYRKKSIFALLLIIIGTILQIIILWMI
jgi:hypothetical protein